MTKANSFQGISPLAKLLCVPVNKRPSKIRDSKLLHVSSGNNTSLAVKKYTHLTNSISGCCNPLAWSLPPVELFVLPFGEPRKETTSSSHYFSAEGISQPGLLCSTTELLHQRKGSMGKCYSQSTSTKAQPTATKAQPRAVLFTVPPFPCFRYACSPGCP